MKDILFKSENYVFSYRVGGVLLRNGRILLQKIPGEDAYALPGGHVSFGESTSDALLREFREEFHAGIQIQRLLMVGENFCPWGNLPCQQINMFYQVSLVEPGQIPSEGSFYGYDEAGKIRTSVEFSWVPLEKLPEKKVYPVEAKPYLISIPNHIIHFVHRS